MSAPKSPPLLSILIPTWNRVEPTVHAVRSAGPDRADVEIVVIDNGSPGDVFDRLSRALAPFGNVRLSRNEANVGMVRNWNRCIGAATGTWMSLLCSDDEYEPDGIDRALALLRPLAQPCVVLQDPGIGTETETGPAGRETVRTLRLPIASGNLWHRGVIDAVGGFDERFEYSADAEFWSRIATRFPVVKVRRPFARYHLHGENYMWTTWANENFLQQTELLARTVLPYGAGEESRDPETLERMVDDGLWRTLTTILRHTFLERERMGLFRKYFPIARERANTPARKADLLLALAVGAASRARRALARARTGESPGSA